MLYETYPDYMTSMESCCSTMSYPIDHSRLKTKKKVPKELSHLDTANVPANSVRMLGIAFSSQPHKHGNKGRNNGDTWNQWVNYIKSHDPNLCIKEAGLLHTKTGIVVAASKTFNISLEDAKTMRQLLEVNRHIPESFHVGERTYCIKSVTEKGVVAFYGGSYLIIAHAQRLIVVAVCTSRTKCQDAVSFIDKVAEKLAKTNE